MVSAERGKDNVSKFHNAAGVVFMLLYLIRPFDFIEGIVGVYPILSYLGYLLILLLVGPLLSGRIKLFDNGTDQMILGFLVAILLSHLSTGWLGGSVYSLAKIFPAVIGYLYIGHCITTRRQLDVFLGAFCFATLFLAVEGIIQYHNETSFFGVRAMQYVSGRDESGFGVMMPRIKWVGVFSDPNDLAMVFVGAAPLLLSAVLERKSVLSLTALCVVVYALMLTASRGGALALIGSMALLFILRKRNAKYFMVAVAGVALLLALAPGRLQQIESSEESAFGRIESWYAGYEAFKTSPLYGVGMGQYTEYFTHTAHNSIVLVLAELGAIGLFFFVGVFYYPLRNGYKMVFHQPFSDPKLQQSAIAATSALCGQLCCMMFLSRAYVLLPYLFCALPLSACRIAKNTEGWPMESRLTGRAAKHILFVSFMMVMGILLVVKVLL